MIFTEKYCTFGTSIKNFLQCDKQQSSQFDPRELNGNACFIAFFDMWQKVDRNPTVFLLTLKQQILSIVLEK